MSCGCGKPKCDGHCGASPAVLQINNPSECTLFHRVEIPASLGDSKTNPPKNGAYKNVLLYYEADQTSWLYSSDGIPTRLTNGLTNYEDAINLPQINGVTLLGDKNSAGLKLADAPMVITIASGNTSWSGADTAEDIYNFFLNQGKVNVVFGDSENYGYEIVSAAYIPEEQKMMCTLAVAAITAGETTEFDGNALFGIMTLYTADKAIDVSQIELQPKLYVTDFTGLDLNYNELSGLPATTYSIGMVKPGDGLSISSDGTLTVIDHVFDTVADMKASTELENGDYAQTLGYHSVNDGGAALYQVKNTGTADTGAVIALAGGLFAHLVYNDSVTVEQFGAYGDGTHDDQSAINLAMQSDATVINFTKGKTYAVKGYEDGQTQGGALANLSAQTGILLTSNKIVNLNFSTVKCIANDRTNYNIFTIQDVHDVIIKDGYILGDVGSHTGATGEWGYGVALRKTSNITLENLNISKCWGDGINLKGYLDNDLGNNTNIYIKLCKCGDNRRQGMSIEHGNNIIVADSSFNETGKTATTAPSAGLDIEPSPVENVNNVKITDCEFNYNKGSGVVLMDTTTASDLTTHNVYGITIDGCDILENLGNNTSTPLLINKAKDYTVKNCTVTKAPTSNYVQFVNYLGGNGHIINNIFNNIVITFRPDMASNGYFEVIGNTFNQSVSLQYNRCVEQLTYTGTNSGNRVKISNNKFIIGQSNLNVAGYIMVASNGFNFAEIDNNYFQYAKSAIRVGVPCSIHDNTIVGCQDGCITTLDNTSTIEINGNHFERCGWNSYAASPIFTSANNHMVITNNNYFKYFLNSELDIDSPAYTDSVSQWRTTAPAVLVSENNNIIASS